MGEHDVFAMLIEAVARQGDTDTLLEYLPKAEEAIRSYDHQLYLGVINRAWGVAFRLSGDYSQAHQRFDQALRIFQGLDTHWQIGRTYDELGELALAQSDFGAARTYFSSALGWFESVQAEPDTVRIRVKLNTLTS